MIIYNDNRLVPTDVNMMVLRNKDNTGYLYVHRSLLEQAVIIEDIYEDNLSQLVKDVTGKDEVRDDVVFFFEEAPQPINYLAPFLMLVKDMLDSLTDMYGALHVMSGQINFRKMLKINPEMRSNPSFSLSIREEYQLAWDRFLLNTMPYDASMLANSVVPNGTSSLPMNGTANADADDIDDYAAACIGEDGVVYDDPLAAILMGGISFDAPEDSEEEEEDVAVEEPVVEEVKEENTPAENKPLVGLDALLGGTL